MRNPMALTPLMGKRIVVRGVDVFDVAMWMDAIKSNPRRLDWVRIRGVTEKAGDSCDVALEVAQNRYARFMKRGRSAAAVGDALVDALTEEAMHISRETAERAEVEGIPELLLLNTIDPVIDDGHWHSVEWSVADACVIKELVLARALPVILRRVSPVGRTVWLEVGLPPDLHEAVARGDRTEPKTYRVYEAIVAAFEAASATRPAISEDDIPF